MAPDGRRPALMPVTTMEEVPDLSDAERAELVASLTEAEAAIHQGRGVAHEAETFVAEMLAIRERAKTKSR